MLKNNLIKSNIYSWVRKIPWSRDRLPTSVFLGFSGGSAIKESAWHPRDLGSILGLGRSPGGEPGNPFQYSRLENPQGQRSLLGLHFMELQKAEQNSLTEHILYKIS